MKPFFPSKNPINLVKKTLNPEFSQKNPVRRFFIKKAEFSQPRCHMQTYKYCSLIKYLFKIKIDNQIKKKSIVFEILRCLLSRT